MMNQNVSNEVSQFYDEVWGDYDPDVSEQLHFLSKTIGEETISGATVLDAGCGTGAASVAFRLLGASEVLGVDISRRALSRARELAGEHGVTLELQTRNLVGKPIAGAFHIVHSFGVLHHTTCARAAFGNLAQAVAPGGIFLVALYWRTWLTPAHTVMRKTCRPLPRCCWNGLSNWTQSKLASRRGKAVNRGFDQWRDMLDWLFVPKRSHHTPRQVAGWFGEHGMESELVVRQTGRLLSTSNFVMVGRRASRPPD